MNNEKWLKYLRIENEDYSASAEVDEGAKGLHMDLINKLPGGNSALDIGCGTGWSTEEISKKYDIAAGISIQRKEINYARENHKKPNMTFHYMDMHELTLFEDGEFDAVYAREVLEHSIAPFILLCEVNRVLKVGGILLVNVPCQRWVDWHCHYIVPTKQQLKSLLDKTNFSTDNSGETAGGEHIYFYCKKLGDIKL